MNMFGSLIYLLLLILPLKGSEKHSTIYLAGDWNFQVDSLDVGETEAWYGKELADKVKLPGSMSENGIGDKITLQTKWTGGITDKEWYLKPTFAEYEKPDNIRFPFWLQPDKKYTGAAWYQKK